MTVLRRAAWAAAPIALAVALAAGTPAAAQPAGERTALAMPGKRTLSQRVIVRPGAQLVAAPGSATGMAVPPLSVFYVYARRPAGDGEWLEVGRARTGRAAGWISAAYAVRWDHNLTLAYASRVGRDRVLFFRTRDDLRTLIAAPDRAERVRSLRSGGAGQGPVVALEPEEPVDILAQFYALAILQAERVPSGSQAITLLELAAIPAFAGQAVIAPPLAQAWTADRDLPTFQPFGVRVLVTRGQLDAFAGVLRSILAQGAAGRVTPSELFDRLRGAVGILARDPARLAAPAEVAGSDVEEVLDGLPYRSALMSIDTQAWLALGAGPQGEMLDLVASRLDVYADVARRREFWVSFDGGRVPADAMASLPLDAVP